MQQKFAKNGKDDIQGNAQGLLYLITAYGAKFQGPMVIFQMVHHRRTGDE
jgi:hypothetical protein